MEPPGGLGDLGVIRRETDSDPEDITLVTGAAFPTCPRQVPKSRGHSGLPGLLAGLDTEQSLGASPVGHGLECGLSHSEK